MYDSSDVHDALNSTYENLVSAIEDFQQRGSGWILDKLIALDPTSSRIRPTPSYFVHSINLLLVADVAIVSSRDFGRLVGSQYSSANHKTYFCRFCLHGFSSHSAPFGKAQHRRTDEDMEKRLKELF